MNNRFKFRVWDSELKYYIADLNECVRLKTYQTDGIFNFEYDESFIVEQCTGLKDKNGKLIFEGDHVICTIISRYGKIKTPTIIEFHVSLDFRNEIPPFFEYFFKDNEYSTYEFEINGSIHDEASNEL